MSFEELNRDAEENKTNDVEFESRVYEVPEEESTIFSAPELHRDKIKKGVKLKKMLTAVIALVLVAAIAVTVAITIPPLLDEDTDTEEEIDPPMMDEALFEEVDRVTLRRDDAVIEYCIIEKQETTTDDDGNEVTETVEEWALKNIDSSLTDYTVIDSTVSSYMTQHYTKKVSEDKNDGSDYGFSDPEYQVDFYKKGSDEVYFSLLIGDENPAKSGRYATTTLDPAAYYIAGVSEFYQYQKVETDFVEPETIPAIAKDEEYSDDNFTSGQLIACDKLVLSGNTFGDTYTVVSQEADNVSIFTSYSIDSPTKRPANDDNIGNIVSLFSYGISADGCYSYSTADSELKKFGLDKPDFAATIYVGNIKRSFSATEQEDGNYAVYYADNKTIMKVSASSLAPASYDRGDLFSQLLFIENIVNAEKVVVESGVQKVEFGILTEYDEEAESNSLVGVTYGGKEITMGNFQNYYQFLVSIKAQSYEEHDTSGLTPTTVLTITHKDGSSPTVVKYYQITTARYQVEVNGVKMGLISSSEHARIMKYANNVANDKEYNAR